MVDAAATCDGQIWVVGYRLTDQNMPAVVWRFAPDGSLFGSPQGETLGDIESTTAFDAAAPCAGLVLGIDPSARSGTFHVAKVTLPKQRGDRLAQTSRLRRLRASAARGLWTGVAPVAAF